MTEHFAMGSDMFVDIHRHETGELQKARIDIAHKTGIGQRHFDNAVFLEPVDAAFHRQLVDNRGAAARVDRPAHQGHGIRRCGILIHLHAANGRQHRHGRLAHGNHMHIGTEKGHDLAHIVDIVIKIETAFIERDETRIDPVGDIDFMGRQKGFHRAAQQGRIMARHRRDDQDFRLADMLAINHPVEMDHIAKCFLEHDAFGDLHVNPVDGGGGQ